MEPQPLPAPTAVDYRDYVEFNLNSVSGRRAFLTDVVALDVVCLEPGQTVDARTFATADAIYTVLGGRAWVVTDEDEVILDALQAVMLPAGTPHGLRNLSPDPLILQVVVSPPDEAPPFVVAPAPRPASTTPPRPGMLTRLRRTLGGPTDD